MKTTLVIAVVLFFAGCSSQQPADTPRRDSPPTAESETQATEPTSSPDTSSTTNTTPAVDSDENPPDTSSTTNTTPAVDSDENPPGTFKPLTAEEQERLLGARLGGGMGHSFRQFSNVFFVSSKLQFGVGVFLMTSSTEIADSPLQSPFPPSYKPTFREFLDAIALQTSSQWKYDPSNQYYKGEVEHEAPVEGFAVFEFTKAIRQKPFEVTLADGWKAIDKGNWVMHVPPSFPLGMDIYDMGTYSSEDKETEKDFFNSIRSAVALQWAQGVNKNAVLEDLTPAKVGAFDALAYESMIPSRLEKEIRWRQWVFMVDDKCYFIVSTIFPEFENKIFPDVKKMLASFVIKKQ